MTDIDEGKAQAKMGHDLSISLGQHAVVQTLYDGWQMPGSEDRPSHLTMIENFNHLEEWRPGTQELREAAHNFLVQNPDVNKLHVGIQEHRR